MPDKPSGPAAPQVQTISAPKGGGAIKGLGETFAPDAFSGTGSYAIALPLPSARGVAPQLSLSYQSGSGNSAFGMGFSLPLGRISRRTERGIPRYDASDIFIDGGDELVLTGASRSDGWCVNDYRPRVENDFSQIQHWVNPQTGQSYWQVVTLDNTAITYGQSAGAQIADPDDPTRIYAWLIEQSVDARGNTIIYSYLPEDDVNVPSVPWENGRALSNKYIGSIQYGNYTQAGDQAFAFQVIFDYGQYELASLENGGADPHAPSAQGWDYRPDPFSSYRSGFEIRTRRRCKNVLLFHNFENALGDPCLVNSWGLVYADEALPAMENPAGLSFLQTVTETGCRRQGTVATDPYDLRSLPPVTLGFSGFQPPEFPAFQGLTMGGDGQPADEISAAAFQPVDMDGEGIAGLLAGAGDGVWYMAAQGGGHYAPPRSPASFPIDRSINDGLASLRDLDGNGELDLTVTAGARTGFYPRQDDGSWGLYTPFAAYPNDHGTPAMEAVSLSANGKSDALVVGQDDLLLYESLGRSGYAPAVRCPKPQGFPVQKPDDACELVTFGDPFGDGLSHRIKVANGSVECWPDLGYGRFGARILIDDAPVFGEDFDIDRLHLADIGGSGVLDLIYVYPDRVALFINRSGNGFSAPIAVALPETCTDLDRIGFADILGNGTTCLTFTKVGPVPRHYFYSFVGETAAAQGTRRVLKPYLLTDIANNLGAVTHIQYASSTQFYLADRAAGRPWLTKLRFPVQVVEEVTATEAITGSRYVQRFAYHDGFYDTVEKEFRGFGYVESWDTETCGEGQNPVAVNLPGGGQTGASLYTPPVYTRSWYHTGVFDQNGAVLAAYKQDYFSGDPQAYDIPGSILPGGSPETVRQAHVALKGHVIRQEVYGQDGSLQAGVPYTVEESNFEVRLIQPVGENCPYAVFMVLPREDIAYHYERDAGDPRVQHDFKFAFDAWGNLLQACTVAYARRAPEIAAQRSLAATAVLDKMAVPADGSYLRAEPSDSQSFEIGNLTLTVGALYFDFAALQAQFETALQNIIPPEQAFSGSAPQARRLAWRQTIFEYQNQPLPLGQVKSPPLVHHVTEAVLTPGLVSAVYGANLTPAMIGAGGYLMASGYWWNPGSIAAYAGAGQFYLPLSTTDPFGTMHSVAYDPYDLMVVSATDPDGTTLAVYDYCALQPWRVTDVNAIVTEALFDPLGHVVVSTVYGAAGSGDSPVAQYAPLATVTTAAVIADPAAYLQKETSFFFYDLACWNSSAPLPPHVVSVTRTVHVSDLAGAAPPPPVVSIGYFDGLGRPLQTRMPVDGSVNGSSAPVWLTTGTVILDNKGNVARQYRPTFQNGYLYGIDTTTPYDSFFYDALGRPLKTLTAKGFYTQVAYAAWSRTDCDADDMILTSPYYLANINNTAPDFADELDALQKAAVFANTPTTSLLDPMGHVAEVQQIAVSTINPNPPVMTTVNTLDIEGKVLTVADPRFAAKNAAGGAPIYNFINVYDMRGAPIGVTGIDCGARQSFSDVLGRLTDSWDGRGVHVQRGYDSMSRLTGVQVTGLGMTGQQVESYTYGTDPALNQVGRLVTQKDEAGLLTLAGYNLEGRATQQSRQVRQDYQNEVNWAGAGPPLDPPLTLSAFYDIGGAALRETLPDGSVITRSYFSTGWSNAVAVALPGASAAGEVVSTQYNAQGQPVATDYGNGTATVCGYESSTGNLLSLVTTRASDGKTLQQIGYTRDPVGNVTRIEDASIADVFTGQAQITPLQKYTYDSLYRLIQATGRENPAITQTSYQTGWKQSAYMPLGPSPGDTKLVAYSETYAYDPSGNMTLLVHTVPSQSSYCWTRAMTHSQTSNRTVPSDMVTPATPPDSFFDANGNLKSMSTLQPWKWNFRNAPASVTLVARAANDDDDAEWYLYDASGIRVRKVTQRLTAGTTIIQDKVYLGGYEIKRGFNGASLAATPVSERRTVLVGDGQQRALILHRWIAVPSGALPPPQFRYQYGTEQGSCALELDGGGLILSYEEYFPYGGTAIIAGNNQIEAGRKDYRYSGKERDDSTGLYYYGARYYAPWLGRWISCDPAGTIDGPNLYAFVGGNPVTYVDVGGMGKGKYTRRNLLLVTDKQHGTDVSPGDVDNAVNRQRSLLVNHGPEVGYQMRLSKSKRRSRIKKAKPDDIIMSRTINGKTQRFPPINPDEKTKITIMGHGGPGDPTISSHRENGTDSSHRENGTEVHGKYVVKALVDNKAIGAKQNYNNNLTIALGVCYGAQNKDREGNKGTSVLKEIVRELKRREISGVRVTGSFNSRFIADDGKIGTFKINGERATDTQKAIPPQGELTTKKDIDTFKSIMTSNPKPSLFERFFRKSYLSLDEV